MKMNPPRGVRRVRKGGEMNHSGNYKLLGCTRWSKTSRS